MEKGDLTYRINGCAMAVHTELGRGFREYVYCRALAMEFLEQCIQFERENWLPIHYKRWRIAHRRCDFLVEGKVMLEIKAIGQLGNVELVQAKNTLERLNVRDGLLINFGAASLEIKRIFNNNVRPETDFQDITPAMVGEPGDDLFSSRHFLPDWLIQKMQHDKLKGKMK